LPACLSDTSPVLVYAFSLSPFPFIHPSCFCVRDVSEKELGSGQNEKKEEERGMYPQRLDLTKCVWVSEQRRDKR
jgi:hypothetical protein